MPFQRRIILAGSTLQALNRLHYDLEPLLAPDRRLLIRYALLDGARQAGARRFADRQGIDLLDWSTVEAHPPDLIVSAGAKRELHTPGSPVALLPHGAGHNRLMSQFDGVAGLSRSQLVGERGELPAFMALPGPAAAARLELECPDAVPFGEITGDLCFERLRLSARMRREYRRALHLGPTRRLVVVTSTWLTHSLFARSPSLPELLVAALPMDDYAVAFVPHPNILSVHGSMESLFRRPLENGLIMVEPDEGWRAAVLAADCVIGDHGSVTFYAAALGVPTAVAAFGFAEMPPESPLAAFGKAAPAFDPLGDLPAQVERLCESAPLEAECFAQAIDEPDPGPAERITGALYKAMRLDRPELPGPKMFAPARPVDHWRPTSAWRCIVDLDGDDARWRRFPADHGRTGPGHLVADVGCLDVGVRDSADIVIHHGDALPEDQARAEALRLLDEHPMAELSSVRIGTGRLLWCDRDGGVEIATCAPEVADAAPSIRFVAARPSRRTMRLHGGGASGTLAVRVLS